MNTIPSLTSKPDLAEVKRLKALAQQFTEMGESNVGEVFAERAREIFGREDRGGEAADLDQKGGSEMTEEQQR